eukprot:jgi/Chlat1/712/Chrsp104S01197
MAVVRVQQLASTISCHAWNADRTLLAICPNNSELHIYTADARTNSNAATVWERQHVLKEHDQVIAGVDWAPTTNRIVTASHDRNAYVWSLSKEEGVWQPTLVLLRLDRAAVCVRWTPDETKFAVGSSAKSACVCYFDVANNWWVSKQIRKKHNSTVLAVAWHPNNVLLATASSDNKCRVFNAFIAGVDREGETPYGQGKFGEVLFQYEASCWVHGVRFSPSGGRLAFIGHDSGVYFVNKLGASEAAECVQTPYLPCKDVLFLSETRAVAVGFEQNPILLEDVSGKWSVLRLIDEPKTTEASSKQGSQFASALKKFHGQTERGQSEEPAEEPSTAHHNCITSIQSTGAAGASAVTRFSTTGLDGKMVLWDLSSMSEAMAGLKL